MQVSIDRASFRGTEAAIARARESLEKSRFPAVTDSEYVIIRQLSLSAEPSELARSVFRETESLLAARVSGWSDDAATADCVWFASENDLYACLCRDIALGRVGGLWFWKQFARLETDRAPSTIARIFIQQSSVMPAMIMALADTGNLRQVWRQLGSEEKQLLLHQAVPAQLRRAIETVVREPATPVVDSPSASPLPALLAELLVDLPRDTDAGSSDLQLAIALFVMTSRPHQAVTTEPGPAIVKLVEAVAAAGLISTASGNRRAELRTEAASPGIAETETKHTAPIDSGLGNEGMTIVSQSAGKASPEPVAGIKNLPEQSAEALQEQEHAREIKGNDASRSPGMKETRPAIDETEDVSAMTDQWYVGQGGLFYLLNVLNQPVIRDRLLNDSGAVGFPSGWGWLYRLGEALGLEYERELVCCLARLSNMEERAFLDDMPRLEAAPEILEYANRRYWGFGVWDASLLNKPAHIAFLRPEVTVSFGMDAIDIELRKSGLDIDPGWIDWLGSMVRFRYREFL